MPAERCRAVSRMTAAPTPPGRTVTWLHFSDLHFTAADVYDRNVVLRTLVDAVRLFSEGGLRPDLVFFTGDIAYSGKPEQYAHASMLFDQLLAVAQLDRRRLFVVPGNHDVDRDAAAGLERTLRSEEESVAFFGPTHPQHHFAKLAACRAWYDEYFQRIRSFPPRSTCLPPEQVEIRGIRLGILGINSALFALEGENKDVGQLWIGRRPLDETTVALEALHPDVVVAAMHHPLEWLHDEERSNIRTKLRATADFILRGHLHETDVEQVVSASGGALHMAAGAAYQTRRYPNRALYVQLDYDAGSVRVVPIRYEDKPQEVWVLDPSVFPSEPRYEKSFPVTWKRTRTPARETRRGAPAAPRPERPVRETTGDVHGYIARAGFQAGSRIPLVGCVIIRNPERLRTAVERVKEDFLHDPWIRSIPDAQAHLESAGFDYATDDPEVRARFIDRLAEVAFEAYVCFASMEFFGSTDANAIFDHLLGRLLFERLRANRPGPMSLRLSRALRDRVAAAANVATKCASDVNASLGYAAIEAPDIRLAEARDPCTSVAEYTCALVRERLESRGSVEARGFERVAGKVRVIHDLATDTFYTRRNPLP